jgi:hypothetical protein
MTELTNVILIPYRNRKEHLDIFIKDIIPLFEKYLQPFKLVIIEQEEGKLFNRGLLLNIGFNEYKDLATYFYNHDVDIYPNELAISSFYTNHNYKCEDRFVGIYTPPCNTLGTIIKFHKKLFRKINGYPNNFWGWGVEDKALQNRVEFMHIPIKKILFRNSINIGDYFTVKNDIDDRHRDNFFQSKTNFEYDEFINLPSEIKLKYIMSSGLNNLEYKIISKESLELNIDLIKVSI